MKLEPVTVDSVILGDVQFARPYLIKDKFTKEYVVAFAAKFDDSVYFEEIDDIGEIFLILEE